MAGCNLKESRMISDRSKRHLTASLAGAPRVLCTLIQDAPAESYDRIVDPVRFTLREMLAHLADWDTIFLERLKQLKTEPNPVLVGIDEGQWSLEHDHRRSDPAKCLSAYIERRKALIAFVEDLADEDWMKRGIHTETGETTMADQLLFISVHDSYHLVQAVDWLA
jgi:uncharacterized damage-inducible protein DinB